MHYSVVFCEWKKKNAKCVSSKLLNSIFFYSSVQSALSCIKFQLKLWDVNKRNFHFYLCSGFFIVIFLFGQWNHTRFSIWISNSVFQQRKTSFNSIHFFFYYNNFFLRSLYSVYSTTFFLFFTWNLWANFPIFQTN